MGFEDEVEQSLGRPCRQCDDRSKRTCELTSSIVPRGTSFHRSVELEFPPIGFDSVRLSCCGRGLLPPGSRSGRREPGNGRRAELRELRRAIGIVFQSHVLLAWRTVLENVTFPLLASGRLAQAFVEVSRAPTEYGVAELSECGNVACKISGSYAS